MKSKAKITASLAFAVSLMGAAGANAQLTVLNSNVPAQFGQAGHIEEATLDAPTAGSPHPGGTLTVNGIKMIVPANSVIQFPASTAQWADLFDPLFSAPVYDAALGPAPAPLMIPAGKTGLALMDNPSQTPGISPFLPFNANVIGNIDVANKAGKGAGAYIVGLVLPMDQDLGNFGQGFITFIDYAKGRFEVSGILNTPNTGTVIEINDPLGRFGFAHSPDPRWSVDADNPTITSINGYPMCIPRLNPFNANGTINAANIDPDCPIYNRPLNPAPGITTPFRHDPFIQTGAPLIAFTMPAKAAPNAAGDITPDPWKMAPLMIGDYVDWAGVKMKNVPAALLDPLTPINKQTYISANTVTAVAQAIYTAPGTKPCYVKLEHMVVGNGAPNITVPADAALGIDGGGPIPIFEVKRNITVKGFCTDSTRLVDIFAADIDPGTGVEIPRLLGTALPSPGIPGARRAGFKGFFRLEVGKGNFLPTTRMYFAQSRNGTAQTPNQTIGIGTIVPPQGGILSGQYHAPLFTFQFVEPQPGFPVVPLNFNNQPFLTQGEGGNPSFGPLAPFPRSTP